MSVLPVQTAGTRILNTMLLFLFALEPYLFNVLTLFVVPQQSSTGLYDVTSSVYALDIGAIYDILSLFTHILTMEERKPVAPDLLRRYKLSRNLEILVAHHLPCVRNTSTFHPESSVLCLGVNALRIPRGKSFERTAETISQQVASDQCSRRIFCSEWPNVTTQIVGK